MLNRPFDRRVWILLNFRGSIVHTIVFKCIYPLKYFRRYALVYQNIPPKWLILSIYLLVFDGSLRRCYAGDGDAGRGAAYVVHAEFGAELHAAGFTSVLAADADFEFGFGRAAFLHTHADKLSYSFLVEDPKGSTLRMPFFFCSI